MANTGSGTEAQMLAADPAVYNRWIIPATETTERLYYQLLTDANGDVVLNADGSTNWFLRTGRILEEQDPIVTANGVVRLSELTALLNTDYRAIVRQGLTET